MPKPGATVPASLMQYYTAGDLETSLASPALFPAVLTKFPPTLILSRSRDFALSGTMWTHSQLIKQRSMPIFTSGKASGTGSCIARKCPHRANLTDVVADS